MTAGAATLEGCEDCEASEGTEVAVNGSANAVSIPSNRKKGMADLPM